MPARKLLRVLHDLGFTKVSQRGSHVKLRGPGGESVVVPFHATRDLKTGLVRGILKDAGIEVEEFLRRL